MTDANKYSATELKLRQPIGVPIGMTVVYVFLGFFCYLAIRNWLDFQHTASDGLISSAIWLILMTLLLYGLIYECGGVIGFLQAAMSHYSLDHAIWIEAEVKQTIVCYGYRLFGRKYYFIRIDLNGINEVKWSSGQASHMTGRDCDDWSTVICFDSSANRTKIGAKSKPGRDIICTHPTGSLKKIEPQGLALIELLTSQGLAFEPLHDHFFQENTSRLSSRGAKAIKHLAPTEAQHHLEQN